jgi:nucleotide-binding universal stress UspA family protein
MYQNILIGIDGSKKAENAFKTGCDLAKALGAKVSIVWIVNRDRGMDVSFGVGEEFYLDLADQAKEKIQPYLAEAKQKGLDVKSDVIIGSTKTILAETYPKEHNIDLIIIGQTGMNNIEKLVVGSHTSFVVRNSACDVLVIK